VAQVATPKGEGTMAVRNFYVAADIDGRHTELTGGPASKLGGFSLLITVRHDGGIVKALRVCGFATESGALTLNCYKLAEGEYGQAVEVAWEGEQLTTRR
jgi:hypothetical protein